MSRISWRAVVGCIALLLSSFTYASYGDRLPEFKECVDTCIKANCNEHPIKIPFHRRLLLWTCPQECDYSCQHIITDARRTKNPPPPIPVPQFHGKWPFYRFLGIQEPFSVLFSAANYAAHHWGLSQIRDKISPSYSLRPFYLLFGYFGLMSWVASMVFHTRDFVLTERADYFAAGASVMYGLYYTPVRIFRLDDPSGAHPERGSVLRVWTALCVLLYVAHVSYLSLWRWDYGYNMGANITVGILQNLLWTWFAWSRYRASGRFWTAWPGMIVAWLVLAMSLEVLDFVPWGLMVDAHSLWHLGTVGPTIWWYRFLVKDAQEDLQTYRFKA